VLELLECDEEEVEETVQRRAFKISKATSWLARDLLEMSRRKASLLCLASRKRFGAPRLVVGDWQELNNRANGQVQEASQVAPPGCGRDSSDGSVCAPSSSIVSFWPLFPPASSSDQ
jgi:hypothetical protein